MKKWKIIRLITLTVFICCIMYIAYIGIKQFLAGNYYTDSMGVMVYYWYDRFEFEMLYICATYWIPVLFDIMLFIVSIVRIKEIKEKEEKSKKKGVN